MSGPEITSVPSPQEDAFFAGTFWRIARTMLIALAAGLPVLWFRYEPSLTLGFAIGGTISIVNFFLLKKTVTAVLDRVVQSGEAKGSAGVVLRFLLRYFLIGLAMYVIFRGSAVSVGGLMLGFSLPVGAIMLEALYATFKLLRHEF